VEKAYGLSSEPQRLPEAPDQRMRSSGAAVTLQADTLFCTVKKIETSASYNLTPTDNAMNIVLT
jgi:hypothetical protein